VPEAVEAEKEANAKNNVLYIVLIEFHLKPYYLNKNIVQYK
jgi:hypothetical protein